MTNKPRILIHKNTKKIGDKFNDGVGEEYIVTGLGKIFTKYVRDDEACAYGLPPGNDYHVDMQYAYVEKVKV